MKFGGGSEAKGSGSKPSEGSEVRGGEGQGCQGQGGQGAKGGARGGLGGQEPKKAFLRGQGRGGHPACASLEAPWSLDTLR